MWSTVEEYAILAPKRPRTPRNSRLSENCICCIRIPSSLSNLAGLRLRNKCSTCSPDTIVFEQFMWSTVEEYSVLIPIRSLGILFGSRLLRCGCPGSPRRSYIYKLPINRPSGHILVLVIVLVILVFIIQFLYKSIVLVLVLSLLSRHRRRRLCLHRQLLSSGPGIGNRESGIGASLH